MDYLLLTLLNHIILISQDLNENGTEESFNPIIPIGFIPRFHI